MGLVPKRSWLGVFVAFYIHLWRAHRKLVNAPQEVSYDELKEPLLDGREQVLAFLDSSGEPRQLATVGTMPGWSGKTVVLVHDMKLEATSWSLVWAKLREDGHRLIGYDLPGHGGSNLSASALELPSLLQDLHRILEHFDVRQGVLVGHGLGGFLALQYLAEYRKHAARLPYGFVCVACTLGDLRTAVGHERLRYLSAGFALLRLPELLAFFDLTGEAQCQRRLGAKASYAAVRVCLDAKRRCESDWALRQLGDLLWTLDLRPAIPGLKAASSLLLSSVDDRNGEPLAIRDAFQSSGKLRYFKMLDESSYSLTLMHAEEVAEAVRRALS